MLISPLTVPGQKVLGRLLGGVRVVADQGFALGRRHRLLVGRAQGSRMREQLKAELHGGEGREHGLDQLASCHGVQLLVVRRFAQREAAAAETISTPLRALVN